MGREFWGGWLGAQGWAVEKVVELMECSCGMERLCCQDISSQSSWLRGDGPKGLFSCPLGYPWGFPGGSDGKASAYNMGDPGSIPGSGRSPGEGNGNPLQ